MDTKLKDTKLKYLKPHRKPLVLACLALGISVSYAQAPQKNQPKQPVTNAPSPLPDLDPAALKSILDFYTNYLDLDHDKPVPAEVTSKGISIFSSVFRDLVKLNSDLCKQKGDGVCGWGSDAGPFLSAQDTGPGLKSSNSELSVREVLSTIPGHRTISVKFNLDPTNKDPRSKSRRDMRFSVSLQDGKWLADDLIDQNNKFSSVAGMRQEISELFAL